MGIWAVSISDQDKSYHHGDLRAVMLKKTIEMLQDTPIETLSLRKLAREVGVSHNAPYMHFKDKDALISAVSDDGFSDLTQAMMAARNQAVDWHGAVIEMGTAYVHFLLENAPLAEVMFRPRPPLIADQALDPAADFSNSGAADSPGPSPAGRALFVLFVALIEEGVEAGMIAPQRNIRQPALHIWCLLHGAAGVIRATRADPVDGVGRRVDEQVASYLAVALKGLAPDHARPLHKD